MSTVRPAGRNALAGCLSSTEKREEACKFCAATLERHYDEQLKRWNAELDMLLVFAGLFSAALTAFNVQSYLLLQPDNTDTIILALISISAQLESFSTNPSFVNSTRPAFTAPDPALFSPPYYAVWMNALWFSSLTCTLSASSIAVMVKQWLHQYGQGLSGNPGDVARLRQYRYDSLLKWHVPEIIAALPILLQTALALFLAGLLILLYSLHQTVAISVSSLVGGLILFTAATTVLPAYFSDCCYQSPQALSVCLSIQAARQAGIRTLDFIQRKTETWLDDAGLLHYAVRSSLGAFQAKAPFRSWQARERPDVDARHDELEQVVALTTYRIISDNAVLTSTVVPCLSGINALSERMSVQYGELLVAVVERLKKADWAVWRPAMPFILVVLSLIVKEPRPGAVRRVLSVMPEHRLTSAKSNLGMLFLLSMTNLVANGIAARDAFEVILRYLREAQVAQEKNTTLGRTVLADVEAAFPRKWDALEEVVDLDNYTAISNYLTGIECVVRYLLRHRATLGELLLPVEQRIVTMLFSFRHLLRCPAWQGSACRQQNVLWAVLDSTLPELVRQLRQSGDTAIQEEAIKCSSAFQDVSNTLLREYSSPERMRTASYNATRQALKRLKTQLEQFSNEDDSAKATEPVQDDSNTQTMVDSQPSSGENTRVERAQQESTPPPASPSSGPPHSERTQQDTDPGLSADAEMDVADISYILDMGIYWDEMPHTSGIDIG